VEFDRIVSGVKVAKLAGPGVPGLEYDPPLYHIDLSADRLAELQADPVPFLRRLGLGPDEVAPDDTMTVRLTTPKWGWNGTRWVEAEVAGDDEFVLDAGTDAGTTAVHSCCYSSGPAEITCHMHNQDPHTDTVFVDD